ncbi:phage tail protein [Vibrio mimicus]|uniref:phage tail protein n=1 Tax=Vibrio mimicus TaxID=674 RepID=UPI002FEF6850
MLKHFISSTNGEYIKSEKLTVKMGYTTSKPLPDVILDKNEYFAMLDADGKVQYWPDDTGCEWQVKIRFEKVTAYLKSNCTQQKEFDDVTLVTDDYTLKEPATRFDEWIDDDWVTNISNQYIAEFDQVDNQRRHLYFTMVDPLVSESNIKRLQGKEAEAIELERQAIAAREKIQLESPWPVNPEA